MAWPYHFVDLSDDQIYARRELLDRYGSYAQLSCLIPVALYQLYCLASWVLSERRRAKVDYTAVPSSLVLRKSKDSALSLVTRKWRIFQWWLGSEIYPGLGTNGDWILATLWTMWLIFLCTCQTGDDYLHLTKRFGIVAISQFPTHYMLSMKSVYSPFALAFRTSHEVLNRYHRILGRIMYSILILHGAFYLNFFIQSGLLKIRLKSSDVLIGISAIFLISFLMTTSLNRIRRWSYRVFFLVHLTIGVTILPLLFFHAHALRLYIVEASALFILDIVARKLDTVTTFIKITSIPHTKLIKLTVPIPASKAARFASAAGQHVYLSLPPESTPSRSSIPSIYDFLFNPFTIAEVSNTHLTIVLRVLKGPTTTALKHLTELSKANPPINIEGPYGTSRHFSDLTTRFDRVLLVAGGVGGTYILPFYRQIQESTASVDFAPRKVELVWAMKIAAEASWATKSEDIHSLTKDPNVKVFWTGAKSISDESALPEDGSVEMADLSTTLPPSNGEIGRPNLRQIVDDVFRQGDNERVAVLACGPAEIARELREHVGRWVARGRDVWWHDEYFGW